MVFVPVNIKGIDSDGDTSLLFSCLGVFPTSTSQRCIGDYYSLNCLFHSLEYAEVLSTVSPDTLQDYTNVRHLKHINIGEDCPSFDGLFIFCKASIGGAIGATVKLNRHDADIVINRVLLPAALLGQNKHTSKPFTACVCSRGIRVSTTTSPLVALLLQVPDGACLC
ncbi:hypothetical protein ACS0TY_018262 [Phlomoides rotata]